MKLNIYLFFFLLSTVFDIWGLYKIQIHYYRRDTWFASHKFSPELEKVSKTWLSTFIPFKYLHTTFKLYAHSITALFYVFTYLLSYAFCFFFLFYFLLKKKITINQKTKYVFFWIWIVRYDAANFRHLIA